MLPGGGLTVPVKGGEGGEIMKISGNLNRIIMAAYAEANVRRHEFITPEHLLYACLFFDEGKEIIIHCGGDPARLKKIIEKHLEGPTRRWPR